MPEASSSIESSHSIESASYETNCYRVTSSGVLKTMSLMIRLDDVHGLITLIMSRVV